MRASVAVLVGLTLTLLVLGCGRSTPVALTGDTLPIEVKAGLCKVVSPAPSPNQDDVEDYSIVLSFTNTGQAPISLTGIRVGLSNPTTGQKYTASILKQGASLSKGPAAAEQPASGEVTIKPHHQENRALDTVGSTAEIMKGLAPQQTLVLQVAVAATGAAKEFVYKTGLPLMDQLPLQGRDGVMTIRLVTPGEKPTAAAEE